MLLPVRVGGGFRRDGHGLGFVNEAVGGLMEFAQFGFAGFVAGELDHVANGKKFAEAGFLIGREEIGRLKFVQEFLGCALGRVKKEKALFERIETDCIGDGDAQWARLRNQRQGFFEFFAGAFVRGNDGNYWRRGRFFPPVTPC